MDELKNAYGPAVKALPNERMRLFAVDYMSNGGNAAQAARIAGYAGVKMVGFRLLQRPDIRAALDELGAGKLNGLSPAAIDRLGNLLDDPNHKDHGKAIFGVLDRVGFHSKTEHKVKVENVSDAQLVSAITQLAGELGLDPIKLLGRTVPQPQLPKPTVEAEFTDVRDGSEGLEDVL